MNTNPKFKRGDYVRHSCGSIYQVLNTPDLCAIEATVEPAYIYAETGDILDGFPEIWIRPQSEMEDGRFTLHSTEAHVDNFIDDMGFDDSPELGDPMYARWMLMHFRLPAWQKNEFQRFLGDAKLFCTYEGNRYRCTGTSRLGDVWLTLDYAQDEGYELRRSYTECTHWSGTP